MKRDKGESHILPEMDFWKILAELQEERTRIEEAIVALERLTLGHGKRQGRPPTWIALLKDRPLKRQGRPQRQGRPRSTRNTPKGEAIEIRSKLNRKNFVT